MFLGANAGVWLSLAALGFCACGSSTKSERPAAEPGVNRSTPGGYKPGSRKLGDDDDGARDGLALDSEQGVLDSEDVEGVLERNFRSFTRCYSRAGDAQRYVEGQVMLRIFVSGSGEVSDVHVIENSLGNFAIERCLVVEARNIKFPAPRGGKPTEFEYPLQFRSTREAAVVDWPEATIPIEVIDAMAAMQPCPSVAPSPVEAIVYIEPSGAVGSAGFLSHGTIEPEAAICALEQIRAWRLRGEAGHMLRARFNLRIPAEGAAKMAPAASPPVVRGRNPKPRRR